MFLRFIFISSLLLPHTVTLWHHHSDHPLSLCCSSSDRLSPHTSLSFSFKTTLFLLAVPHSHLVHGRVILLSMETQLTFVCTHSSPSAIRLVSVIPASLATWFKTIQSCYLIIIWLFAAWRKLTDVTDLFSTVRQEIRRPTTPHTGTFYLRLRRHHLISASVNNTKLSECKLHHIPNYKRSICIH